MQLPWPHAEDDPAAPRPRRSPPQAQGPGRSRRTVAVGLSPAGGPSRRRASDAQRAAPAARPAGTRGDARPPRPGGESRARAPMIVIDASAVLEVLLNTPDADAIAARFFAPGESLHAPHLLDL